MNTDTKQVSEVSRSISGVPTRDVANRLALILQVIPERVVIFDDGDSITFLQYGNSVEGDGFFNPEETVLPAIMEATLTMRESGVRIVSDNGREVRKWATSSDRAAARKLMHLLA